MCKNKQSNAMVTRVTFYGHPVNYLVTVYLTILKLENVEIIRCQNTDYVFHREAITRWSNCIELILIVWGSLYAMKVLYEWYSLWWTWNCLTRIAYELYICTLPECVILLSENYFVVPKPNVQHWFQFHQWRIGYDCRLWITGLTALPEE